MSSLVVKNKLRDKKILFVTYQSANANNFLVVADAFRKLNFDITVVATNVSRNVWTEHGYEILNDSDELGYDDAVAILKDVKPKLLIAGTSMLESIETKFLKAARTLNIISVSFIDFWNKYRERYELEGTVVLSDRILVLDDVMKKEMVKQGFPEGIINVVGSPHLEWVRAKSQDKMAQNNDNAPIRVAFFSQPIAELYGSNDSNPAWFGYHEGTVVKACVNCLKKLLLTKNVKIDFTVNLHPREKYDGILCAVLKHARSDSDNSLKIKITQGSSVELLQRSDVILGMTTIVLLESVVMGKATLSVQINSNGRFKFIATEHKMVESVFDEKELYEKLESMFTQKPGSRCQERRSNLEHLYRDATMRFSRACLELIQKEIIQ